MINPNAMAIAAMTVMLWIMWSDTIRAKRPSQILYTVRIALFLIISGILVVDLVRHPAVFAGGSRGLAITAVIVGLCGAGYFARRLVLRR
ncbi:MAG: hypothetical protein QOJ98_1767 [Acidobacteriota bacterium]|jgi:hypothetical protein|nr:hypothetical protein [Acidobacteriota bacterium]